MSTGRALANRPTLDSSAVRGGVEVSVRIEDAVVRVAVADAALDVRREHELCAAGEAAVALLGLVALVVRRQRLVFGGGLQLEPADVVDDRRPAADLVAGAEAAVLRQQFDAQEAIRIEVQRHVAGAGRPIEKIGRAVDVGRAAVRVEGAQALLGVDVEAHSAVIDLPGLEAAEHEIPLRPFAEAHPGVVGVDDPRLRLGLILVGDDLRLRLDEEGPGGIGRRHAQQETSLLQIVAGAVEAGRGFADVDLLVRVVDPAVARDADAAARVIRPLRAVERHPHRAAVEAARVLLGIGGRRKAFDRTGSAALGGRRGGRRKSRRGRLER